VAAYATAAQLATYTGDPQNEPTDDRQLTMASTHIDTALIGAFYATDTNGNPTDAIMIQGLQDATCAQVEYWRATGDELGLAEDFEDLSIGSVTLRRGRQTTPKTRGPILAPKAIQHLRLCGLWPVTPVAW
jgi:hypothetical protein